MTDPTTDLAAPDRCGGQLPGDARDPTSPVVAQTRSRWRRAVAVVVGMCAVTVAAAGLWLLTSAAAAITDPTATLRGWMLLGVGMCAAAAAVAIDRGWQRLLAVGAMPAVMLVVAVGPVTATVTERTQLRDRVAELDATTTRLNGMLFTETMYGIVAAVTPDTAATMDVYRAPLRPSSSEGTIRAATLAVIPGTLDDVCAAAATAAPSPPRAGEQCRYTSTVPVGGDRDGTAIQSVAVLEGDVPPAAFVIDPARFDSDGRVLVLIERTYTPPAAVP